MQSENNEEKIDYILIRLFIMSATFLWIFFATEFAKEKAKERIKEEEIKNLTIEYQEEIIEKQK